MFYIDHCWDTAYEKQLRKSLCYATTEKKLEAATAMYKKLPGFQDKQTVYGLHDDDDDDNDDDTLAGFLLGKETLDKAMSSEGYITYPYTLPQENRTAIDIVPAWLYSDDVLQNYQEDPVVTSIKAKQKVPYPKTKQGYYVEVPFFASDATLQAQERPATFAHRLMQSQGLEIYPKGPQSEFWNLKRWAIAMQTPWEKVPYVLAQRESSLEEDEKYHAQQLGTRPSSGEYVYTLIHYDHPTDSTTSMGTFSSYAKAKAQVTLSRTHVGFRDVPHGFYIDPYRVDHTYWQSGYASKTFQ